MVQTVGGLTGQASHYSFSPLIVPFSDQVSLNRPLLFPN
jgi:hypothetical protein